MILAGSIIIIFYTFFMGILYWGYRFVSLEYLEHNEEISRFSIIIPFRNEIKNLHELLDSIQKIDYPSELFEILFVDDESTDGSSELINDQLASGRLKFRILNNERHSASPKKDAITLAVEQAKFQWILTTDADCMISAQILKAYNDLIQKKDPYMIAGPLGLINSHGLKYHYQNFENLGLQSLSVGGFGIKRPFLCNGANLAYKKDVFELVEGFKGNDHISSGDDIFLFEKIKKKYPEKVNYLKSKHALVLTHSLNNWKHIIEQRVRWASKTSEQRNIVSLILGMSVFSANIYLVFGLIWCFYDTDFITHYLLFIFFKSVVDLIIISPSAGFFDKRINLLWFMLNSFIYPIITQLIIIRSLLGKYEWKGRRSIKLNK